MSVSRMEQENATSRYYIRSVQRALRLLKSFSPEEPEVSLTELSKRLGLNISSTFRLLVTLQSQGYVEQIGENGKYRLGVASLELGSVFLSQVGIRQTSTPVLEALRQQFGETVHLSTLDRNTMEVIYLEKLEGLLPIIFMSSRVGGRAPAYCTGVGKALLAHEDPADLRRFYFENGLSRYTPDTITDVDQLLAELAEIRQLGFAVDEEEHEIGVKCVAAPIWNHETRVIAAISVSGPVNRMNTNVERNGLIEKVIDGAGKISANLGASRFPHASESIGG